MRWAPLLQQPPDYLEVDKSDGWMELLESTACLPRPDISVVHEPGADSMLESYIRIARVLGTELHPAQAYALRVMSELRDDGDWAFIEFGLSTPRQVGKTVLMLLRMLRRVFAVPRAQVLFAMHNGTEGRSKLKRDIWPMLEDTPLVEYLGMVKNVSQSTPMIELAALGAFILIWTGSAGAAHGSSLEGAVLDEIWEHEDDSAEQAILNTLSFHSQYDLCSTHGTEDSYFFLRKRRAALKRALEGTARDERIGWIEWGAADGLTDAEALTIEAVESANPAVKWIRGVRERAMLAMRTTPVQEFRRAQLNQTVPAIKDTALPGDDWRKCLVVNEEDWRSLGEDRALGIDAGFLRRQAAAVLCDSSGRVELKSSWSRAPGVDDDEDLSAWVLSVVAEYGADCRSVSILAPGPLAMFSDRIGEHPACRKLATVNAPDSAAVCGWMFDRVVGGYLKIKPDPTLNTAAMSAQRRDSRAGSGWVFARPDTAKDLDISPLIAAALAVHAATYAKARRRARFF